jgi:hypothetical protein
MIKNKFEQEIKESQAIFPLICFIREKEAFECLGTGFFVNPAGWFITAKHVLCDRNDNGPRHILAVQTLKNGGQVVREVTHMSFHPSADIMVGKLEDKARDIYAQPTPYEFAPHFNLSFKKLDEGEDIIGYGYPKTVRSISGRAYTFDFTGNWSRGSITEFLEDGSALLQNKCYATTMRIDSGASGGPVFHNNCVVGVNSSSWELPEEDTPLSYVTPVDLISDLLFPLNHERNISVQDLIKINAIIVKS